LAPVDRHGWVKPAKEFIRLNDASFDMDIGSGATGAILRDGGGLFTACCNSLLPFVEDATSAEAVALKNGLDLAGSLGCNRIIVESTSKVALVNAKTTSLLFNYLAY
jgi:ribonuclease HI